MKGKTVVITGASRGIGLGMALKFAKGNNIVVLTKDTPSNIETTHELILKEGGKPLVLAVDVGQDKETKEAIEKATNQFGGIDILINNTSATCFTDTIDTTPEQFDLLISTSVKAAFFLSQTCYPYLQKAENPHIINISPPLNIEAQWLKDHLAFSIAKYAMSLCTLGMSEEFQRIAVNSLWPQTTIASQTIKDHFLPKVYTGSRLPSIVADAAYIIASGTKKDWTGQFFIDEVLLRKKGMVDFSHYSVEPGAPLMQPLFIPLEMGMVPIDKELFLNNKITSR